MQHQRKIDTHASFNDSPLMNGDRRRGLLKSSGKSGGVIKDECDFLLHPLLTAAFSINDQSINHVCVVAVLNHVEFPVLYAISSVIEQFVIDASDVSFELPVFLRNS